MSSTQRVEKKPVTLRGQQTRQILLQAAEDVFQRRGFARAGVGEIAQRAGVATGTFYVHFENKESLFLAVVEDLAQRLESHVAERARSHGHRISRQRAVIEAFFDFVHEHPHLYRLVRQAEDVDAHVYRGFYERIARAYADGLAVGMAQGEVSRFEPEVLAYVLMGVLHFVGMRFVEWEQAPKVSRGVLLEEVTAFIEAGLKATRVPRVEIEKPATAVVSEGYSFFR